jgi:hypothetical protein
MISSAEQFVRLRESLDPFEYNQAARDISTDEIWFDVISRFPDMTFWVAVNKTISENVIRFLAENNDERVRCAIAMKRKTPIDILLNLMSDHSYMVRSEAMKNPKLFKKEKS